MKLDGEHVNTKTMKVMDTLIKNYINSYTETFREWLAWKIFPEQDFYIEAIKRMAEYDENVRCVKALEDADSACSGWAVETIKIKLNSLNDLMKRLEEEGYDEPPF